MALRESIAGVESGVGKALGFVLSALLALVTALAAVETLLWVAFERSHAALPELQGLLLAWMGLLGAAHGVREGLHLSLDLVPRSWGPRIALGVGRLSHGLVGLFGALLAVYGHALVGSLVNTLPGTGLPAAVQYWPTVVAGLLIFLFSLRGMLFGEAAPADG